MLRLHHWIEALLFLLLPCHLRMEAVLLERPLLAALQTGRTSSSIKRTMIIIYLGLYWWTWSRGWVALAFHNGHRGIIVVSILTFRSLHVSSSRSSTPSYHPLSAHSTTLKTSTYPKKVLEPVIIGAWVGRWVNGYTTI